MPMTYDEWAAQFRPIQNPNQDHGFDGTLFETYGADLEAVQAADSTNIWTLYDGDDNHNIIMAGMHVVNRVGYFITELPYDDPMEEVNLGQ